MAQPVQTETFAEAQPAKREPPRPPPRTSSFRLLDGAQDAALNTLNAALLKLEPLICCKDYCTEGGFSYDDIDLWSRLRSMTIVKGVQIPPGVRAYLDNLSELGDVPLYDCMAI